MKRDKNINISVRAVFIGRRSAEQVFTDLIRLRHQRIFNTASGNGSMASGMSSNTNVYHDARVRPNWGVML